MLAIEAVVIEVLGPVADDSRAVGHLRIDRVTMSAAIRDAIVYELRRRVQFDMLIEVDCVVVLASIYLPGPGLPHGIIANDYSNRPLSAFGIRVEVDPVPAGAFERETIDDDVTLLARVGSRV